MEQQTSENRIASWLDSHREELTETADYIFQHPELAYQEVRSSEYLAAFLERHGFTVERGTAGIETAFTAQWSNEPSNRQGKAPRDMLGKPIIGFLAEYDALAELGHACGHNLLGTGAAAAACAFKSGYGAKRCCRYAESLWVSRGRDHVRQDHHESERRL